ncbi:MAG: DNA-directed RNA polymerase subunit omega [Clostridia bacterium]|nr:DNA-directed RNA polymerase subunit omega [Clostridia bacterium]
MIYPSIEELTKGKYNRYELVIATAKCARLVTDEYMKQRETAEKLIADKQTDKSLSSMIKREYRDEKAVKNAINRIYKGEVVIVERDPEEIRAAAAARAEEAAPAPIDLAALFADEDDDENDAEAEDAEDSEEE